MDVANGCCGGDTDLPQVSECFCELDSQVISCEVQDCYHFLWFTGRQLSEVIKDVSDGLMLQVELVHD